jgi:hypothetical protein
MILKSVGTVAIGLPTTIAHCRSVGISPEASGSCRSALALKLNRITKAELYSEAAFWQCNVTCRYSNP